ncbi:MAG: hypothetical protein ABW252_04325 [Polyangiales bacterium]
MQSLTLVLLLGALACLGPSRARAEAPSATPAPAASVAQDDPAPAEQPVPLRVSLPRGPVREHDAPSRAPARPPLYKNAWLWAGVGVFVAAAAISLGLGLQRETRAEPAVAAAPFDTVKGP